METSLVTEADYKYPAVDPKQPREEGWLPAVDGHEVHWQEYGRANGEPLILIHGGPGGSIPYSQLRMLNPDRYRIIVFDQRGCGKSRPHVADDLKAAMHNNITQATIDDIERLREARGLGTRKAHIYGGSWGSTAAIAYAEQHPDHVENLVLRGIFLCDKDDLSFFYQGNAAHLNDLSIPGAYRAYRSDGPYTIPKHLHGATMPQTFKTAWERYVSVIPEAERGDMIAAYHDRLTNPKYSAEERTNAALAWTGWEYVTSFLNVDMTDFLNGKVEDNDFADPRFAIAFATIENEYFYRALKGKDPVLSNLLKPENIARISHIPTRIAQGTYDQVCVRLSADKFHKAMEKAGAHDLEIKYTVAGHAQADKETYKASTHFMDTLPPMKKNWRSSESERPAPTGFEKK